MARIIRGSEVDTGPIMASKVAMIGYGNQGRPQARNLRDSGVDVVVGLYDGSSKWSVAESDGFRVVPSADAVQEADFVMLCLPDTKMAGIYARDIEPHLSAEKTLAFCHGFNIRFGLIEPPPSIDVVLVGPKGTGPSLRAEFEVGRGIPALVAVHNDATGTAMDKALAYASAVGAGKSFMVETTFSDETEADLFGEQAILCGGLPELIKSGMETLIRAGISPEVAYFECLHDCKVVLDLIYERGFSGMRIATSETAQWGGLTVGPKLIDEAFKAKLEGVLEAIRDGSFAKEWVAETEAGMPNLRRLKSAEVENPVDGVAEEMRR